MSLSRCKHHTPHGAIALADTGGPGLPIVMLHGSGASGAVFSAQLESPLANHFRLIAIDLPGHGDSDRFSDPGQSYGLPEIAATLENLLAGLGIGRAVIFGWSLGGHIALEMMARTPHRLAGVMLSGAPPIDAGPLGPLRAFHLNPAILLASRPRLSRADAERLVRMCYGAVARPEHVESVLRSDPHMRMRATRSLLRGEGANQRRTVETSPVPLAVIHGTDDPAIRTSYLTSLDYANLWDGKVHLIADGGHAPFLAAPHTVNMLLHRFATEAAIGLPRLRPAAVGEPARTRPGL